MKTVHWKGDIYISNKTITEKQYKQKFEGDYISLHTMNSILKDANKHVGVSCDYLKFEQRQDVANAVTFGIHPKYTDIGFQPSIFCKADGKDIPFENLPVMQKAGIVDSILEEGKKEGITYIE